MISATRQEPKLTQLSGRPPSLVIWELTYKALGETSLSTVNFSIRHTICRNELSRLSSLHSFYQVHSLTCFATMKLLSFLAPLALVAGVTAFATPKRDGWQYELSQAEAESIVTQ